MTDAMIFCMGTLAGVLVSLVGIWWLTWSLNKLDRW